jgi:hypothetical protein
MLGTHHLLDGYYADRAGFVFNYKTLPERLPICSDKMRAAMSTAPPGATAPKF